MLTDESRARDFPTLAGMTYLNSAAEGIPPLEVGAALARYFSDKQRGMDGREPHFAALTQLKELTATLYGLSPDEIGICSCSSEAYNLAALALRLNDGDEVVLNDLDFPAGATPWLHESSRATVRVWRSRQGVLDLADLPPLLGPRTRLVATSLVSFYNGFRIALPELARLVRQQSPALLSVDVTQALGRIPLDVRDADLIVSSTHKWILASHGGGLVGVPRRRATEWTVPAGGWLNLEEAFAPDRFDRRARSLPGAASFSVGMPNFPAVYAVGAALGYITRVGVPAIDAAARPLVEQCLAGLKELPVELLSPRTMDQLAGILAFRHPHSERLHDALRRKNIHVMHQAGRIRIALHGYNRSADVEQLLSTLHGSLNEC